MLGTGSLQVVLGYLRTHWRALGAAAALVAVAAVVWFGVPPAETYGVIHLDSPQVYTRERLVNDRFTEEAWLRQQLERTQQLLEDKRFDAPEARISRNFEAFVDLLLSVKGPGGGTVDGGDEQQDAPAVQWPAALQTFQDLARASAIEQDPAVTFERARNYRDAIRADLLQTQLDDRHDIGGNTLYRLTFDASILPGDNTHRAAQILVALERLSDDNPMAEDERNENGNGTSKILRVAYEGLYLDWQKHLQLAVTNAIDAQTDELLRTGTLTGIDGLALQEFIVSQLMKVADEIQSVEGIQSTKDEEQQVQQDIRDAERQRYLADLINNFKTAYEWKLRQDEAESFADHVMQTVNSQSRTASLSPDHLPMELCRVVKLRLSHENKCPGSGSPDDRGGSGILLSAVEYAEQQCSASRSGSFPVLVRSASPPGQLQLPCPRTVSIEGTNIGELALMRQLRFIRDSGLRASGEELHKSLCERLYPAPSGCDAKGSTTDQTATRELFKLHKTFVRRVLAEYVRAKLNNEIAVVEVGQAVNEFFDVEEQGCSYDLCNLVFRPTEAKFETFKNALEEELGMIFTYSLDPSSEARSEELEETDQALLRAEAGGSAPGAGIGGAGRLGSGVRSSRALEMRHQAIEVMGFERPPPDDALAKAEFGWVIRAGLGSGESNPFDRKRQEPVHHQLSAVVSIPSWWRALSVTVRTAWLEEGEDPRTAVSDTAAGLCENDPPVRTCSVFELFLPGSVAEVSELFRYEVRTEPYIDARSLADVGPQSLEVGRKGLIVLEGGRLWRGTIVTAGHLRADKITVLPDMNGVIAEFECVEPPPGLGYNFAANEVPSPNVVVWTSEGRSATPYKIELRPFKPRGEAQTERSGVEQDEPGAAGNEDVPCSPRP
jgi:hypothetical protein